MVGRLCSFWGAASFPGDKSKPDVGNGITRTGEAGSIHQSIEMMPISNWYSMSQDDLCGCIHRGASNSNTRRANIASLLKCHGPYMVFIGMAHITDSSRRLALIQLAHRPSSWIWRSIPKKYHCKSLSRLYLSSWI